MKSRVFPAAAFIILGLLIAIAPTYIFPTCTKLIETASGGTMPMKCFWSGRAEIGIGLLVLCGGILLGVFQSAYARIGVSAMIGLGGVLGILMPTLLIGGCKMATMPCRMASFPAVIILNIITIAAAAANLFYLRHQNKKIQVKADGQ